MEAHIADGGPAPVVGTWIDGDDTSKGRLRNQLTDKTPGSEVFARMYRDSGKGVEARRCTVECLFRSDECAARIRMKTRDNGVEEL